MKKKGIALLLTGVIMASCSMPVYADREDAKLDVPYISLGADLNAQEKASVLELLGVSEKDLEDYTVATVTNKDEHNYLDSYLDKSVIGSRALSSVLVEGKEDGNGIHVTTKILHTVRRECTKMPLPQRELRMRILWWQVRLKFQEQRLW